MPGTDRITRVLILNQLLEHGEIVFKSAFAQDNSVTERTVERDIHDIRLFLSESYSPSELIFDSSCAGYRLSSTSKKGLSGVESLLLLKMVIGIQALKTKELATLIDTILSLVPLKDQSEIKSHLLRGFLVYQEPIDNKSLLKIIWDLHQVVTKQSVTMIKYTDNCKTNLIKVCPFSVEISGTRCYFIALRLEKSERIGEIFSVEKIESITSLYEPFVFSPSEIEEMDELVLFIRNNSTNLKTTKHNILLRGGKLQ